jgi:hypothetical protein
MIKRTHAGVVARRYSDAVVIGDSRDFLAAVAATAGALTGLLFVAMSVAPRQTATLQTPVVRQVRASAALIAFTNALAVSLYGLVPDSNVGYPAAVFGVIGILFSAAGAKSIMSSLQTFRQRSRQIGLIVLLMLIFGVELISGITVIAGARTGTPGHLIGYALVTSVVVGISRAWELVGDRDTGLFASVAVLTGHTPASADTPGDSETAPPSGA